VNYSVQLLDEVDRDIDELSDFYRDMVDDASAERFEGAFEEMIKSLGYWSRSNKMFENDDRVRRRDMASHKVAVIYVIDDEVCEVIAVKAFHFLSDDIALRKMVDERLELLQERKKTT
jgi:hypothetical protein